jgi:ABC-2 type transport system ATP-binding protein
MTAIQTIGLSKRYPVGRRFPNGSPSNDVVAVDDLDLTVEDGAAFGFLGPNGAGKSTTIDMLLGFREPTSGTATVLGHDVQAEPKAARKRIGVLPDDFGVYDRLSGRDHVETAIRMNDAEDDAAELLEYVGLEADDWDRPVGDYSTGMCRRLGLATALVGDPELLVLDEPTSGLDPNGIQEVRKIVREQTDAGRTVFFSSHVLSEVEAVCDRVGIMNDGRLVAVDDVAALRETIPTEARVELTVDTVPGNLDVSGIDGVSSVETDGSTVRAFCTEPTAKMAVIREVDHATEVRDVVAESGSLESVFNAYATGESA